MVCCSHLTLSVSLLLLTVRRLPLPLSGPRPQPDGSAPHGGRGPPLQLAEGDHGRRVTLLIPWFARAKPPPASHQVNQSLSKIYVHVEAYRLYVGRLKEGQQDAGLPSKAAHDANAHLRHLSNLLTSFLQQVKR